MNTPKVTDEWKLYQQGINYYSNLGLYKNVNLNEAFYAGEQWCDENGDKIQTNGLPAPVFNIFKQVINYLISTVLSKEVTLNYCIDGLPDSDLSEGQLKIKDACQRITAYARRKWEALGMDAVLSDSLLDAAISGNGVFFTYWDDSVKTAGKYGGDFVTKLIDSVNLFPADPTSDDFDSQAHIIISGRDTVYSLQKQAERNGIAEEQIAKIVPDTDNHQAGKLSREEISQSKCTFLIKMWKDERTGTVRFRKSTRYAVISPDTDTGLRHYPIAQFAWDRRKGSWIGQAVATGLVPNQRYINQSFSMVMYHMMMTAFSKVVYNADKVEGGWDNSVGSAIPVTGDVENVAKVIDCGQMQPGMLDTIDKAMQYTKELMGATDVALGIASPNNATALNVLYEASVIPLEIVKRNMYACLERIGMIWLDFMLAYYPDDRLLPVMRRGVNFIEKFDASCLNNALTMCRAETVPLNSYKSAESLEILNRLLERGDLTFEQYLERLPEGVVPRRQEILAARAAATKDTAAAKDTADLKEEKE